MNICTLSTMYLWTVTRACVVLRHLNQEQAKRSRDNYGYNVAIQSSQLWQNYIQWFTMICIFNKQNKTNLLHCICVSIILIKINKNYCTKKSIKNLVSTKCVNGDCTKKLGTVMWLLTVDCSRLQCLPQCPSQTHTFCQQDDEPSFFFWLHLGIAPGMKQDR